MAARSGNTPRNGAAPRPKGGAHPKAAPAKEGAEVGSAKKTRVRVTADTKAKAQPAEPKVEGPGRNEQAAITLIAALRELGHIRSAREELIAANLLTNSIAMDLALEDRNGYWLRQASITTETLIQQLTPEHRDDDPVEQLLRGIGVSTKEQT